MTTCPKHVHTCAYRLAPRRTLAPEILYRNTLTRQLMVLGERVYHALSAVEYLALSVRVLCP